MNLLHLHPMLVHFPIALALVALVFDLAAYYFKQDWLNKAAVTLTVFATMGACAALFSGAFLTKPVAGLAATLKDQHVMYALVASLFLALSTLTGLFTLLKFKNQGLLRYIFTACLLVAALFISLTGMVGGSIVYDVWLF
ncbi:MAG: DUF2231 domain-containing protein [Alistipes sp.]